MGGLFQRLQDFRRQAKLGKSGHWFVHSSKGPRPSPRTNVRDRAAWRRPCVMVGTLCPAFRCLTRARASDWGENGRFAGTSQCQSGCNCRLDVGGRQAYHWPRQSVRSRRCPPCQATLARQHPDACRINHLPIAPAYAHVSSHRRLLRHAAAAGWILTGEFSSVGSAEEAGGDAAEGKESLTPAAAEARKRPRCAPWRRWMRSLSITPARSACRDHLCRQAGRTGRPGRWGDRVARHVEGRHGQGLEPW